MQFDTSATINLGGQDIPVLYLAIAMPVLALVWVGYSAYMAEDAIMPRMENVQAKEDGLAQKRAEAEELKVRTKEVDQVKAEITALEKSITLLRSQIPTEAQVSVLLFDIERMAKQSQGSLNSFEPGALRAFGAGGGDTSAAGGAATSDIQEMPVTISATASYPEVINLLGQLNAYERKLNVSNLTLKLSPKGSSSSDTGTMNAGFKNTLDVNFTLLAYVLKANGATP